MIATAAVAVSLVAAMAARHLLVEPADVAHRCDAAPWASASCIVRSIVVQAFVQQRLGIAAWALAVIAWPLRSTTLALAAGVLATSGLVLYGAGLSAPAAVVALLAWLRAAAPPPGGAPSQVRRS